MRSKLILAIAIFLSGCAAHSDDCAAGLHHTDCLPGTAGYDDSGMFAAADDRQCQASGNARGTSAYTDCRVQLKLQHSVGAYQ